MNNKKYIEQTFLSEDKLVDKSTKTRILNIISARLESLYLRTTKKKIITKLNSLKLVIEDAYVISLYKFQFTALTQILNKELSQIEDEI